MLGGLQLIYDLQNSVLFSKLNNFQKNLLSTTVKQISKFTLQQLFLPI